MPTALPLQAIYSAALATVVAGAALLSTHAPAFGQDSLAKGEYIFNLAGCEGCHTDKKNNGPRLAGGRAFKTDYGTFFSPNITPDPNTGIGKWTFDDFKRALREGIAPDGSHYFPAFPYTSYTHMTDDDIAALWAYMQAQPATNHVNTAHDLKAPFGWRWLMVFWNALYLDPGPKSDWDRGRYVTEALSHCHECHTPRNLLGGYQNDKAFAGTISNPEGITVPNITPDPDTGIGKWSEGDLKMLFTTGMLPDGDFVGGVMSESISHSTSKMTAQDRQALIRHLQSLPPVHNPVKAPKAKVSGGGDWN
ncbi:c-type cytochrome [Magnetovibrio sp.]|uniref:c-type cytochrome n=1 Tax=Magnetovibrio sp. TaxID=2024836 RepID=UPI002F92BB47